MYRVQTDARLNTHTRVLIPSFVLTYAKHTWGLLAYFQIFWGFKTILISKTICEGHKDGRKQNEAKRGNTFGVQESHRRFTGSIRLSCELYEEVLTCTDTV